MIETEGADVQEEDRPVANKDLNGRTGPLQMANLMRSDFVAHRSAKLNDNFGCTYLLYTIHFFVSFLYKIYSKCNEDVRSARKGSSGRKMTVRKHFRLKLAYGRQGLDWIVEPGYSFGVFSTSRFAARALSSVDDPKMLRDQHLAPTDLLWSKNVF